MITNTIFKWASRLLFVISSLLVAVPVSFGQKKKAAPPAVVTDPALTPENIQKVLDDAYNKFKDVKEETKSGGVFFNELPIRTSV